MRDLSARASASEELKHLPRHIAVLVAAVIGVLSSSSLRAESCRVDHCHDGDTCTLDCAGQIVKVRLYCVDAPEIGQKPWGTISRDFLRERLPAGSSVDLVRVPGQRDRRQRTIGVLLQPDGANLNLDQVQSGWAAVYPRYCADPVYYMAQEDAEAQRRGIWRTGGAQQRPWEWRAAKRRSG